MRKCVALARATSITDSRDTQGKIDIKSVTSKPLSGGRWEIVSAFYAKVPPSANTGNEYPYLWNRKPKPLQGAPAGAFKQSL